MQSPSDIRMWLALHLSLNGYRAPEVMEEAAEVGAVSTLVNFIMEKPDGEVLLFVVIGDCKPPRGRRRDRLALNEEGARMAIESALFRCLMLTDRILEKKRHGKVVMALPPNQFFYALCDRVKLVLQRIGVGICWVHTKRTSIGATAFDRLVWEFEEPRSPQAPNLEGSDSP